MITPWFLQVLELYFVVPYPKNFYQNLPSFKSLWEKQFLPCPVDRPSRPTCTAVHVCTSVDRPVDREQCLCFVFPRSTGPVDRRRDLLSGWDFGRLLRSTGFSTVGNPTVDGWPTGRPTVVRFSDRLPTAIFFWLNFCVGFLPNDSFDPCNLVFIPYK